MSRVALALALLALLQPAARAGGDPDPGFLRAYAETHGFMLGRPVDPQPTPDGKSVLFLRAGARSPAQSLYQFDSASGQSRLLLSPAQLDGGKPEVLSPEVRARLERRRVTARGFTRYELSRDGRRILVEVSGRLYLFDRASAKVTPLPAGPAPIVDPRFSPDGKKVAYVRDRDLYVLDLATSRERRLTRSTDPRVSNGLAEFVAQEEMERMHGFWWSPDSRAIAFEEADTRPVETFHLVDVTQPTHDAEATPYPRAGTANARVRVGIVSVTGGRPRFLAWDAARLPYLTRVVWKDRAPLTLVVEDRKQQDLEVLTADPHTGRTTRLLADRDDAWIDLDPTVPRWLPDGSAFLWSSEATGRRVLELHASDGGLLRRLGESGGYRRLDDLDPARRIAWFEGSPDPTVSQLYRVSLDGGPAEALTNDPGIHHAWFGEGHELYALSTATASTRPVVTVHRSSGALAGTLPSVAEEPPFVPDLQLVTVGKLGFEAAITRPRQFQVGRKYPVVVEVYGGPTAQIVTRDERWGLLRQWIADHGFVVVAIDGRGTPSRGRDWSRAIRGDFGAVPLEDQVAGLRALGARFAYLDLTRVGITGWSFGGYLSALAVMRRPDVYQVAVAGAPVTDWRDYDTFYTERYLGLPDENKAGYDHSSLLTWAKDLARPLLLVHGTRDDNVYFFQTLKLCDALFRAGRRFDLLPLAGFTHMVPDPTAREALEERIVGELASVLKP